MTFTRGARRRSFARITTDARAGDGKRHLLQAVARQGGVAPADEHEVARERPVGQHRCRGPHLGAQTVVGAEVVHGQDAHTQAHFGPERVQRRVERFFGDAELGQAHGQDAVLAPDEEGQGRLRRGDLQVRAVLDRGAVPERECRGPDGVDQTQRRACR